jgi:hypothetical protein
MIRDMNVLSCKSISISYSMGEEEEVNGKTDHLDFQVLGSRGWVRELRTRGKGS